ncbi:hypothetical protein [Oligoflexus tunisiensis]|uniref:hypothetical protein n=1 Tax=Oligoflexus tunisiensis TaxID=708132 RepID=UPI00114CACC4|nr:hypothetical protein [Oligoflexus tunisiensis]
MMKVFIGLISLCSSVLFAQDYYAPTSKDKEPLARFPLSFEVQNGVMLYTLPAELTGVPNNVRLDLQSEVDGIRTFSGPKGTAVCMGVGDEPGCVVRHKGLQMNKELARTAILRRFEDPQLQRDALAISSEFIEHSGNEPIGFLGALKRRSIKWVNAAPAGRWSTYFVNERDGGRGEVNISFVETSDGYQLTYPNGSRGDLSKVRWTAFHAAGNWAAAGSEGWFDFSFNEEINKFEGFFGSYKTTSGGTVKVREGRWYGERLNR